jgi:diguanylate cyclase (GGDEF)-like protein
MAEAMHDAVRQDVDLCCRIGGDEFAVVAFALPDEAEAMAARIFEAMDGRISIGLARLEPEDSDETLLQRADRALYASKNAGRGRITNAERDPTEAGAARD